MAWIRAFAVWLVASLLPLSAGEEAGLRASKADVRREIVATIDGQLGAFRKQDLAKAYSYSAAALRQHKPIDLFMAIVRTNYPEIWASTRAEFGIVRDDGENATVLVHVYGKDSDASYDYGLVRESGAWRIKGVLRHTPTKEEKV